jgi:site-specific DNA recombinase
MDVNDVALGHTAVMRWNPTDKWVTSKEIVHEPLISDSDFERVQPLLAHRARTGTGTRRANRSRHPCIFRSLLYCAVCRRRMQGQHAHGVAYYRCRYPQEHALSNKISLPRT